MNSHVFFTMPVLAAVITFYKQCFVFAFNCRKMLLSGKFPVKYGKFPMPTLVQLVCSGVPNTLNNTNYNSYSVKMSSHYNMSSQWNNVNQLGSIGIERNKTEGKERKTSKNTFNQIFTLLSHLFCRMKITFPVHYYISIVILQRFMCLYFFVFEMSNSIGSTYSERTLAHLI